MTSTNAHFPQTSSSRGRRRYLSASVDPCGTVFVSPTHCSPHCDSVRPVGRGRPTIKSRVLNGRRWKLRGFSATTTVLVMLVGVFLFAAGTMATATTTVAGSRPGVKPQQRDNGVNEVLRGSRSRRASSRQRLTTTVPATDQGQ
jgi:hypothetical protein